MIQKKWIFILFWNTVFSLFFDVWIVLDSIELVIVIVIKTLFKTLFSLRENSGSDCSAFMAC